MNAMLKTAGIAGFVVSGSIVAIAGFQQLHIGSAAAAPKVGAPAPNFTATDSNGKKHSLSDFKGKTVVLEWTNHDCPFVKKHYSTNNMQQLQQSATGQGVVWLSIVSSAPAQQGFVDSSKANELTKSRSARPTAVLLDPNGTIGRMYGARTTPHMYIIAPNGTLAYMGAIDDKPTANPADVAGARNYVAESLAALKAGKPVPVASTQPYGCSVKYAP